MLPFPRVWFWRISVQYSVFFARRRTRTPRKNMTILPYYNFYPQSQSEYYASLKRFSFFSIASLLGNATFIRTGTFRPPPLLYRPRGPGKLSSATAKQSNRANSIDSEYLFFMILVNLVVLLLCSCLFWVSTLCWLERSIKFDWFDCVRLPNLIEPIVGLSSIEFDKYDYRTVQVVTPGPILEASTVQDIRARLVVFLTLKSKDGLSAFADAQTNNYSQVKIRQNPRP